MPPTLQQSATELQQMDTYNPEQAAALIGNVSASTIRNWCKTYAAALSEGANPQLGTERRLTQSDVATLQQVKVMRDNRRTVPEILAALQQSATTLQLTIDAAPAPPPNAQEARSDDIMLPIVLSSIEKRQDATDARVETVDKRIDDLQRAVAMLETRQAQRVDSLITGIVLGVMVAFIVGALALTLGS